MDKINRTTLFLILTFVISFSLAGFYKLFVGEYAGLSGTIFAVIYMFIPMISAIIVEKVVHKEKLKANLFISFKINIWFLVAWLITPVVGVVTLGISFLFPDVSYSPEMAGLIKQMESSMTPEQMELALAKLKAVPVHPIWIMLLQGMLAGATVNAVAGFGEELGWRGFLVKQFKGMSFFKASFVIGAIWGIWHSPLILMGHNYPQHPQTGVLMMTLWCILLTPLFLYITVKSKSVIAAALMHGTLNGTAGIAIIFIDGGNDLTVGITGLAGFIALVIVTLGFFVFDTSISKERIMVNNLGKYL